MARVNPPLPFGGGVLRPSENQRWSAFGPIACPYRFSPHFIKPTPHRMGGMAKVLIFGAGRQGRAIALNLAPDFDLWVGDGDTSRLLAISTWLPQFVPSVNLQIQSLDASQPETWGFVGIPDVIVNAASYTLSESLTDWAIEKECHLVDLGGNPDVVASQHKRHRSAVDAAVSIIPDCGLAPGLAQILAAEGLLHVENPHSVSLTCGGLPPTAPNNPWRHALYFAAEGLLNEYRGTETILVDGEAVEIPCLSGKESVEIPGVGVLEAAVTRGGVSTAPATFLGRLDNYIYKTLRWPGHWDVVGGWARDGFLASDWQEDALGAIEEKLGCDLPTPDEDLVVLRAEVSGRGGMWQALLLEKNDPKTGLTAMERTTGFPAAEVVRLAAKGELKPGVLRHEADLPTTTILQRLEKAGLSFQTTSTP
ncbi:saccharopine dehydrogenase NADP-binding domain-containing protein [bacterium]|nr:saccharopine dehydrogenase NADP-binding domain-containing protein [bacterium]